jgi:hypothetical protein
MAVRRTKLAQELIQKWQNDNSEIGKPLNAEVIMKTLSTGCTQLLSHGILLVCLV